MLRLINFFPPQCKVVGKKVLQMRLDRALLGNLTQLNSFPALLICTVQVFFKLQEWLANGNLVNINMRLKGAVCRI